MHSLRLALRALAGTPIVSLVVVVTLALGIGANTAIFSVLDSLLLRSLTVPSPGRLMTISSDYALAHGFKAGVGWNYEMWTRFQQIAPPVEGALAWAQPTFNLAASGERQPANGLLVSGSFFRTLGVSAHLGRLLTDADDVPGGGPDGPVAVISYRLWQERFGGASSVLGSRLTLDRVPFTIVGVTPPAFLGLEVGQAFDVAIPLGADALINGARTLLDDRRRFTLAVLVRLRSDQSIDAGTAALRAMQPEILGVTREGMANVNPSFLREPFVLVPAPTGTSDFSRLRTAYQRPVIALSILVGLVLLIACANLASVLLARATHRRYEIAVRIALGATRRQIVQQLMIESLVLAGLGAAAGLLVAGWGSRALVAQLSTLDARVLLNLTPDASVLAFTAAAAIAAALFFGTAPAFHAASLPPVTALRGPAGARQDTPGAARVTSGLVALQMALSLMLVVTAGLFIRTFDRLARVPLGFDSGRVLLVSVDSAGVRVEPDARLALHQRLGEVVATVPGVAGAASSTRTPLDRGSQAPILAQADRVESAVAPGWFATYGIPLRAGRDIDVRDTASAPRVAVVNDAYVRKFLIGRDAVGAVVEKRTVIGVVADTVFASVRGGTKPTIYVPLAQSAGLGPPGSTGVTVSVRAASGDPVALARSVGAALSAVDPGLVFSFRPLQDHVRVSLLQERLVATLSALFGGLALLLAGLGLYGATAYVVGRRTKEIGLRIALGASGAHIFVPVLRRSVAITVAGLVVGVIGAVLASRYAGAMLFGVTPLDPLTFVTVAAIFVLVAAAASVIPARRASRIDPLTALRAE